MVPPSARAEVRRARRPRSGQEVWAARRRPARLVVEPVVVVGDRPSARLGYAVVVLIVERAGGEGLASDVGVPPKPDVVVVPNRAVNAADVRAEAG